MAYQNFSEVLQSIKGTTIGLFLHNHRYMEGLLIDVKEDHLVVEFKDDIFYVATQHINGVLKNTKDYQVNLKMVPYINKLSLSDVYRALKYRWVTINRLNGHTVSGIISSITDDHIVVIHNEEQLYIKMSFITDIFDGDYDYMEEQEVFENNASENIENDRNPLSDTPEELNEESLNNLAVEENDRFLEVLELEDKDEFLELEKGSKSTMKPDEKEIVEDYSEKDQPFVWSNFSVKGTKGIEEDEFNISNPTDHQFVDEKMSTSFDGNLFIQSRKVIGDNPIDPKVNQNKFQDQQARQEMLSNSREKRSRFYKQSGYYVPSIRKQKDTDKEEKVIQHVQMNETEKKEMIKMQYLSLMKHAERMYQKLCEED